MSHRSSVRAHCRMLVEQLTAESERLVSSVDTFASDAESLLSRVENRFSQVEAKFARLVQENPQLQTPLTPRSRDGSARRLDQLLDSGHADEAFAAALRANDDALLHHTMQHYGPQVDNLSPPTAERMFARCIGFLHQRVFEQDALLWIAALLARGVAVPDEMKYSLFCQLRSLQKTDGEAGALASSIYASIMQHAG